MNTYTFEVSYEPDLRKFISLLVAAGIGSFTVDSGMGWKITYTHSEELGMEVKT